MRQIPKINGRYDYVYHSSNLGIDNIIHKYCIFSYDWKPVTIPWIVNTRTLSQTLTRLDKELWQFMQTLSSGIVLLGILLFSKTLKFPNKFISYLLKLCNLSFLGVTLLPLLSKVTIYKFLSLIQQLFVWFTSIVWLQGLDSCSVCFKNHIAMTFWMQLIFLSQRPKSRKQVSLVNVTRKRFNRAAWCFLSW